MIARHPPALGTLGASGLVLLALLALRALPGAHLGGSIVPGHLSMAAHPGTTSTVISSHAIPDLKGKRMTAVLVDFPPGAVSPEHHHEGSLTVYVLKGTIRSQLNDEPIETYTAGQSFFEPLGSVHAFAENPSATEDARILAVFLHDEGARLTVYH